MLVSETVDKVHGRDKTRLCRGAAYVCKVRVAVTCFEGSDDATVKSDLGRKVGQVKVPCLY